MCVKPQRRLQLENEVQVPFYFFHPKKRRNLGDKEDIDQNGGPLFIYLCVFV